MEKTKLLFLTALLFITISSYGQAKFSPGREALKLFNKQKAAIEKKDDGIIDDPSVFVADINGDKLPDCILSFVVTAKGGGNAIIDSQNLLYLNTGNGMKAAVAFSPFKFCYYIDHIADGIIYVKEYECAPPYNKVLRDRKLAYRNGKVVEIK